MTLPGDWIKYLSGHCWMQSTTLNKSYNHSIHRYAQLILISKAVKEDDVKYTTWENIIWVLCLFRLLIYGTWSARVRMNAQHICVGDSDIMCCGLAWHWLGLALVWFGVVQFGLSLIWTAHFPKPTQFVPLTKVATF